MTLLLESRPVFCAPCRRPTLVANTNARRSAGSPDWCRLTDLLPRGSSPACPPATVLPGYSDRMRPLLREPGSIHDPRLHRPLQYILSGIARSACPAASAKLSMYIEKRFSYSFGLDRLPAKQFYV